MAVRLENLTTRLVTVVLNSGEVLHLPPGHVAERAPVEVEGNAKVDKLSAALVLAVTESEDSTAEEPEEQGPKPAKSSKKPSP